MDRNQKADVYKRLMYEHDILENKINSIKSLNFELNQQQENEVKRLKLEQGRIMQQVERLMMM